MHKNTRVNEMTAIMYSTYSGKETPTVHAANQPHQLADASVAIAVAARRHRPRHLVQSIVAA